MENKKSILQKISSIIGILCFVLAVVCLVFLYIKIEELGMEHVISASLLASTFFFVFIGFIFVFIGRADIPNLKMNTTPVDSKNTGSHHEDETDNSDGKEK